MFIFPMIKDLVFIVKYFPYFEKDVIWLKRIMVWIPVQRISTVITHDGKPLFSPLNETPEYMVKRDSWKKEVKILIFRPGKWEQLFIAPDDTQFGGTVTDRMSSLVQRRETPYFRSHSVYFFFTMIWGEVFGWNSPLCSCPWNSVGRGFYLHEFIRSVVWTGDQCLFKSSVCRRIEFLLLFSVRIDCRASFKNSNGSGPLIFCHIWVWNILLLSLISSPRVNGTLGQFCIWLPVFVFPSSGSLQIRTCTRIDVPWQNK